MWCIGSLADLRAAHPVFLLYFLGLMKIKIFAGLFHFVLIAMFERVELVHCIRLLQK